MSGSNIVNANMTAWELGTHKALEAAMDQHIQRSVAFAKTNHRWQDQGVSGQGQQTSGGATSNIAAKTEPNPAMITSQIYGDIMTNVYLEKAWFFQGRYKILEQARSNNLLALWTHLRAIMKGKGFIRGGI